MLSAGLSELAILLVLAGMNLAPEPYRSLGAIGMKSAVPLGFLAFSARPLEASPVEAPIAVPPPRP
jgi:hypothetical protein